jgi:hypothetical protein
MALELKAVLAEQMTGYMPATNSALVEFAGPGTKARIRRLLKPQDRWAGLDAQTAGNPWSGRQPYPMMRKTLYVI